MDNTGWTNDKNHRSNNNEGMKGKEKEGMPTGLKKIQPLR